MKFINVIFFGAVLFSSNVFAEVAITSNASGWRMQDYIPGGVVLWFTGSTCSNGQLLFRTDASSDDKKLLWATITTAKSTGSNIYIYYDNTSQPGACFINSFGFN